MLPRKRVARLMRKAGLRGCIRGRRKHTTTRRDERAVPAGDRVKRNFCTTAPDKLWTADITCLHTDEGFLYLAFVLDVLLPQGRRLVDDLSPQDRTRARRFGGGGVE